MGVLVAIRNVHRSGMTPSDEVVCYWPSPEANYRGNQTSNFPALIAAWAIIAESIAAGGPKGKVSAMSGIADRARLYRVV